MLIVPGNVPELLEKAPRADTDVVILDIQDAVARSDRAKLEAREMTMQAVRKGGFKAREVCVRVNSPGSIWIVDDIKAVVAAGADSIMLSRCYGTGDIQFAEGCLYSVDPKHKLEILLEVDTAAVLCELEDIARTSQCITGIAIGSYDLSVELGAQLFGPHRAADPDQWMTYARGKVVTVARWKGWNAGDVVNADPRDPQAMRTAMQASRSFGFDGTTIIFPRTLPIAHEVFGVSEAELAWAQGLVKAWRAQDDGPDWNKFARKIDGEMTMLPTYEYAERVIRYKAAIDNDPAAIDRMRAHGLASDEYLVEKKAAR